MHEIIFWITIGTIIYAYIGYTLILLLSNLIKRKTKSKLGVAESLELPHVTLLIASYNEKNILSEKITNCQSLNYPKEKLTIAFVTDGSDDGSEIFLGNFPDVIVYHQPQRQGKTAAINRVMPFIKTPVVIFSDANSILNADAIYNMVSHFNDPQVGCVAGEKRIEQQNKDKAVISGESFYWNYESYIKWHESQLQSTISAAGELYAIRTNLYQTIANDTVLDDFTTSMLIALKGFRIKYEPLAYAVEKGSLAIQDEMKRKIRIAAGGFQMLVRYPELLNPFAFGWLSLQYWSHKVLRWAVVPFAFILAFLINGIIVIKHSDNSFYSVVFLLQLLFYVLGGIGFIFKDNKTNLKVLFLPFYLITMNFAQIAGLIRFIRGRQPAQWEKVGR